MDKRLRVFNIIDILFYIGLAIAVVFYIAVASMPHEDSRFDSEDSHVVTEDCKYINENGEKIDITLPAQIDTGDSMSTTIEYVIPEHFGKVYALCIRTSQQSIEVTYEGELIYAFGTDKSKLAFGKSPGSSYNIVRLPMDSAGKTVTLKITAFDKFYKGYVNELYVGTKAALLFYILKENLLNLVIALIILVVGAALLISGILFNKILNGDRQMRYIGWFALLLGSWLFAESKTAQFFIGNQILIYLTAFITLCVFIVPILQYVKSIENFHYKKLINGIICYIYLDTLVIVALQVLNIFQFFEMLLWIQGVRIVAVCIVITILMLELFKHKNKGILNISIAVMVLGISAILEALKFQFARGNSVGGFLTFGLLVFISIIAYEAVKHSIYISNLSREAHYFERMAKTDIMTKTHNRTAYIEDIEKLSQTEHWKKCMVIMADINNLKEINDSCGHHIGDEAIIKCSECLCEIFSSIGNCYRIGGDEFACIIAEHSQYDITDYLVRFEEKCKRENEICTYLFEVAIGCTVYAPESDREFADMGKRADRLMYEKKELLKTVRNRIV